MIRTLFLTLCAALPLTAAVEARTPDAPRAKRTVRYAQPAADGDASALGDATPETVERFAARDNLFDFRPEGPVRSYKVWSSGLTPAHDPAGWVLCGSDNGRRWRVLDRRDGVRFCSRYQEVLCTLPEAAEYAYLRLEFLPAAGADTLALGGVTFYADDLDEAWRDFRYPEVNFTVKDPDTRGAALYGELVQDPEAYVRYHTRKVAEILFYTARDSMPDVRTIDYTLRDVDGISAKGGRPPRVNIFYSTRHVERSAEKSMYRLDFETRGVLYHELTHAYQFNPKGIGSYGTNKECWACIEGLADAVRAEAGLFEGGFRTRRPGGHWLDGYRTTGFFIQWLTTKDPDAIRKFHLTVRDMEKWSFDGAMKAIFGPDSGIEHLWNEYQTYLRSQQPAK